MNGFFTSDAMSGISMWTIVLSLLECASVFLFLAACICFVRITEKAGNKNSRILAMIGAGSAFVGGFPNALDKVSRTLFSYDLWFDSTWMFFFVSIAYVCLWAAALNLGKGKHSGILQGIAFIKGLKYVTMLVAAVGMTGYYITMYKRAEKKIGRKALWYFATFLTTAFLVVFSAVGNFTTVWPNIIAQIVNSSGYAVLLWVNREFLKSL